MRNMTQQTKFKLNILAKEISKTMKDEYKYLAYPTNTFYKISEKMGLKLCKRTINFYYDYLTKVIDETNNDNKRGLFDLTHVLEQNEPTIPREEINEVLNVKNDIKTITVIYSNGDEITFVPQETKPAVDEQTVLWIGLFDYKNDNEIIIRRGWNSPYLGCNVKSQKSILKYFGTLRNFERWCKSRYADVLNGKIKPNVDTTRDMDTLSKIINKLESMKTETFI